MSDEGIVIEVDGRIVGVAVPVRGGFMFFSFHPDLKVLEATVYRRAEMLTGRTAEILQARLGSKNQAEIEARPNWSSSEMGRGNVVRLRPRHCRMNTDPEPPDAA